MLADYGTFALQMYIVGSIKQDDERSIPTPTPHKYHTNAMIPNSIPRSVYAVATFHDRSSP